MTPSPDDGQTDRMIDNMLDAQESTYLMCLKCMNCGDESDHNIKKGTSVRRYKEKTQCRFCGCYLFEI